MENKLLRPVGRLASIDAYRGLVMLLMWGEIWRFRTVLEAFPDSNFWKFIVFNTSHVPWYWAGLHDMIQPSFTFLAGVSLPFSIASRIKKGQAKRDIVVHAVKRSLILILLGIFLRSIGDKQTYFTFEDTLTQIGLGYVFLVLLGFTHQRNQIIALVVILLGYWLAFALYPLPGAAFDYAKVGVPVDWAYHASGFAGHWNLNANLGWAFDKWFLNLFPRESPFEFNRGGYATLSFIPTLGTMILGLLAGNTLKSATKPVAKLTHFLILGAALITLAVLLHFAGINPIVKKIWTPAWTLFSGGICFLFLAAFYSIMDIKGYVKWAFPLLVIGANSIVAYVIADAGLRRYIDSALHTHLGQHYDEIFGPAFATVVNGTLVIFIMWLMLYWMYRKKIFIKI